LQTFGVLKENRLMKILSVKLVKSFFQDALHVIEADVSNAKIRLIITSTTLMSLIDLFLTMTFLLIFLKTTPFRTILAKKVFKDHVL